MKKLHSVADAYIFYPAPNQWTDPMDDLPISHDLSIGQRSGEACMVSQDAGKTLFVSVGERFEDWVERRRGTTL